MESARCAGPLLRLLRLQKNWSQETMCRGICAVSYLSKIEQGKVDANPQLLEALFQRLDVTWKESAEMIALRDALYEGLLSCDDAYFGQQMKELEENWNRLAIGPCYVDFVVIRAYHHNHPDEVPNELEELLDGRQRALLAIIRGHNPEAYRLYPCPLTAFCVGEEAYRNGNHTQSLEYLQIACDQAAREGYAYLLMNGHYYMVNCYSDMGNLDAMYRHGRIVSRLGRVLGAQDLVNRMAYNIAATKAEFGDFEGAYGYFSALKSPDTLDLHKLAVCCEALGKTEEALSALDRADRSETQIPLEKEMCDLVRYRLEHPDYLQDEHYGELLMNTFERIRKELHSGFARFHLRWVTQWLTANRQYRTAYELIQSFPGQYCENHAKH